MVKPTRWLLMLGWASCGAPAAGPWGSEPVVAGQRPVAAPIPPSDVPADVGPAAAGDGGGACTAQHWQAVGPEAGQAVQGRLQAWIDHLRLPARVGVDVIEVQSVDPRICADLRAVVSGGRAALGCTLRLRRGGVDPCL